MKLGTVRHSLDRLYFTVFSVEAEHQARKNRSSVDEHRTRATLTELAAVFCAGEIQILTQNFEQRLVRCEGDLCLFAVECETDVLLTVERQRLSSLPYSKSCCRSVASCRRTQRGQSVSDVRRPGPVSPASLHQRLLHNRAVRVAPIRQFVESDR